MPQGYTVVLGPQLNTEKDVYRDTALPFAESTYRPKREYVPERIREMRHLSCDEPRERRFYRQAVFMEDYEDDVPWTGNFACYFPTYRDMNTVQLRGYFTWRTHARRGEFQQIPLSAAYIYIYELLNGVGASSPEDVLSRLSEFIAGYAEAGFGDRRMRQNLYRWMLEYAVLKDVPVEEARRIADPEMLAEDRALAVLRDPDKYPDGEVFSAICFFGGAKIAGSPVIKADPERGAHLFSEAWRSALAFTLKDRDLFTLCFGEKKRRHWYPLYNTVYYEHSEQEDREYELDESRTFFCRDGIWQVENYTKLSFDRAGFQGFLHETDARLRRYLKTGRYLKERPMNLWAVPYIDAVIEADRQAAICASRPKITIDLSGLDQIRRDAGSTRDSLLTEEELRGFEATEAPQETVCASPEAVHVQILRCLLQGGDVADIIRVNHLMPSIAADAINEAMFDEIGDTVVTCEDDRLELVGDYIEDLEQLLGGEING